MDEDVLNDQTRLSSIMFTDEFDEEMQFSEEIQDVQPSEFGVKRFDSQLDEDSQHCVDEAVTIDFVGEFDENDVICPMQTLSQILSNLQPVDPSTLPKDMALNPRPALSLLDNPKITVKKPCSKKINSSEKRSLKKGLKEEQAFNANEFIENIEVHESFDGVKSYECKLCKVS